MSKPRGLDYPAVAIIGPTGSGKTLLGLALAERFSGEIVACDALQVYRHMDIGTAKPAAVERARIPHHMLDLREPCDDFTAGDFMRLGRETLQKIKARGRVPFVVGGTGFYLRALIEGLFQGPGRSEELRTRMRRIVARRGPGCIYRALQRIDPEAAARLNEADAARTIRALEVYLLTRKTMSWWQKQPRDKLHGFRWLKLGIRWQRHELYARIDRRVEAMIMQGFVKEVEDLMAGFPRDCHAFKAIGYRQIVGHLEGKSGLDQTVSCIQQESRRYAKRQLTWFRADPEIVWMDAASDPDALLARASELVSLFLA